jgi:hypothetical protein
MEVTLIVFIIGCVGTLYQRSNFTAKAIEKMQKNPTKYVSLIQAATFDEMLTYFLGLVVFVANLKLLKLFRFNHRIYLFTRTLSTAKAPLLSFMMVFSIFYIAYCSIYYLVFGSTMYDYRSMISTIESLFNTLLGGFDFNSIEHADRLFGPALFFSFMLIMVMILMNIFLTILMDAFAEVQGDENLKANELEVFDHALSRLDFLFKSSRKGNKVGDFSGETSSQTDVKTSPSPVPKKMDAKERLYDDYTDDSSADSNAEDDKENVNEGEDSDNDDALDQAIRRAQLKLKLKQMVLLGRVFHVKPHGSSTRNCFIPLPPERTLDEKLVDLATCFRCVALDDIALDRAYEELLRQYVKNRNNLIYEREMERQAEFASSWQRPQTFYKQSQMNVYTRYMLDD